MYSDYDEKNEQSVQENSSSKNGILNYLTTKNIIIAVIVIVILVLIYFLFIKNSGSLNLTLENNPEYIKINDSRKINIKINGELYNGTDNIKFTSNNQSVLSFNNNIAVAGNYPGYVNVTVLYNKSNKSYTGSGQIVVYKGDRNISPDSITIPDDTLKLRNNDTFNLGNSIGVMPENAYVEKIDFNNYNSSIIKVNESGMVEGLQQGETDLVITVNNRLDKKIKVIVGDSDTSGFSGSDITFLDGEEVKIAVQETKQLNLNTTQSDLMWKSSDEEIVTVSGSGSITGIKEGTAKVTVSTSNGLSKSINVTVESGGEIEKIEFTQIEITKDNSNNAQLTMKTNDVFSLTPTITPVNASNKSLIFDIQDSTIISGTPSIDGTSLTITALKAGTTTITVKSSNNISAILKVIVSKSGGGSQTSSNKCYCNSSNRCTWSSGPTSDYINKQSTIPNATACSIYSNNNMSACFKDSKGEYIWGKYGNTSGYSYVAGISSSSACKTNSAKTSSLTCPTLFKGQSGQCVITSSNSSKIASASTSNEKVVKIDGQDTYKVKITCVDDNKSGSSNATITAMTTSGDKISSNVYCKSKSSISLICNPTSPAKGNQSICTVSGLNNANELESCSSNKGSATKRGTSCVVTSDSEGKVTVTAKTTYGSTSREINFVKGSKNMSISCNSTSKIGVPVNCTASGPTNIKCSANNGANATYTNGKCTVTYNGTTSKEVTVTFTADDAQAATRKINFNKDEVKSFNVYCSTVAKGSTTCSVQTTASGVRCSANNGAKATYSNGKCTVTYNGTDANHMVTVTFSSNEVITESGGKSKTKTITFNPQ